MKLNNQAEIVEAKEYLKGKYNHRNSAYRQLRRVYNADYWSDKPQIKGIKLVYNLIANVVDKYTDFMSQSPDWRMIPTDMSPSSLIMADKQEKLLYSQWELNNIPVAQQWQAHLQALLGFFGFEVLPAFNEAGKQPNPEKLVKINVLNPDFVLPMPKTDNIRDLDFVIIDSYDYTHDRDLFSPEQRQDLRREQANVTKYYDDEKIVIMVNDKEKMRIEHGFGFINIILGQNRVKPHSIEGIGDLDQSIGLQQYLNELISWQADIIEYAADPITLIKGYSGSTKLTRGPGATWELGPEGEAKFLTWPGSPPDVENMISRIITAIQDVTNINDPVFGRDIPSGTSGAAVQSLLSGIQATMLRKQIGMGDVYVNVNEIILRMVEKFFGNKEINIRGTKKGNVFIEKFMGSEINGNYRSQAIWPAGVMDKPSQVNLAIQKLSVGLISKRTAMEEIGVLSPTDEQKLIRIDEEQKLTDELVKSGQLNPQQDQFNQAAGQLAQLQGGQPGQPGGASEEQQLAEIIQRIDKLRGAVFFGGKEGDKFVIVLTEMKDKATIVNRLPEEFKGRISFRAFKEDQDEELQMIVEEKEPVTNG